MVDWRFTLIQSFNGILKCMYWRFTFGIDLYISEKSMGFRIKFVNFS